MARSRAGRCAPDDGVARGEPAGRRSQGPAPRRRPTCKPDRLHARPGRSGAIPAPSARQLRIEATIGLVAGYDHDHSSDRRMLAGALALIVGLLVAEIVVGLAASSLALLADAGHMLTD